MTARKDEHFYKNNNMKATETQKILIEEIRNQVGFWSSSNDINSPTHMSDIDEEMEAFFYNNDIEGHEEELGNIIDYLQNLYREVKKIK